MSGTAVIGGIAFHHLIHTSQVKPSKSYDAGDRKFGFFEETFK
jgi:hypothetical protein